MKPKLLMTASTFSHITNFHLPYLRGFRSLGWEVHVACGGALKEIPEADRCVSLPFKKSILAPSNFRAAREIRRLVQREDYALIIMHTSLAACFTRLALLGLRARPKTINVVHGYLFDASSRKPKALLLKAAESVTAPLTDRILTMNQHDFAWAAEHAAAKEVLMIPGMGADAARVHSARRHDFGLPEDSVVLIYPAEFSARKNQAMLIRAMTDLPDRVHLVLPGRGDLLDSCAALAQALGVQHRVHLPGYVSDVIPMLQAADIAVSASYSEGLPFNLIEAMQIGLPIVASCTRGHTDLIQSGDNGFLYPCDDMAKYVQALTALVDSPALRAQMGAKNREAAKQYALDEVYSQVMDAYLK